MDRCIIHYDSISTVNRLPEVTVTTLSTLQNCKAIREILGEIICAMNRVMVFQKILTYKQYYYHPECSKKYVYAKTLAKRKENKDTCEPSRSKRQKGSNETRLFDDNWMICKQHQIKGGHKFQSPKKLLTLDAANNIKKAAEMIEDEEILLDIAEVNLVAKEFKHHDKCYRDYTRVIYANKIKIRVNEKGNFEDVCRLIEDDIIESQKWVSMNVLIDVQKQERTNISTDHI